MNRYEMVAVKHTQGSQVKIMTDVTVYAGSYASAVDKALKALPTVEKPTYYSFAVISMVELQ